MWNPGCETLYIADYKYVNISSFAVLGIKLWLEDNVDLKWDDLSYSFKFIQSKAQNWYKLLSSFSYNFMYNIATWFFAYL